MFLLPYFIKEIPSDFLKTGKRYLISYVRIFGINRSGVNNKKYSDIEGTHFYNSSLSIYKYFWVEMRQCFDFPK